MHKIKQFWAAVAETNSALPEFPMMTSIEDRFRGVVGGVVSEVGRNDAAKLIVEGSHRLATEKETTAYYADQAECKSRARAAELLAEGHCIFRLQ